jgi:protein TonB
MNYQEITKAVTNLQASLSPDEPVHPEPGLTPATAIFTPDPEPAAERWYGIVVVSTVVGSDGRVRDPRVVRSVSSDVDGKTLDAIRKWAFRPARKDGRPVALELKVEVAFPIK